MPTKRLFRSKGMQDMAYMKPEKFQHYLTMSEAARAVGRDPSRLRKLEAQGRIPQAHRVTVGKLSVRLWSPEQIEEIRSIISALRPGRRPHA